MAARAAGRIALVGCVKSKRSGVHPACDLYDSPLFRARRGYVEARGLPWFILSAAHGLVKPVAPLHDYDESLNAMSAFERRTWGTRVVEALVAELAVVSDTSIEIHAGSRYVAAIEDRLTALGALIEMPTRGLGIGEQLAWYRRQPRP